MCVWSACSGLSTSALKASRRIWICHIIPQRVQLKIFKIMWMCLPLKNREYTKPHRNERSAIINSAIIFNSVQLYKQQTLQSKDWAHHQHTPTPTFEGIMMVMVSHDWQTNHMMTFCSQAIRIYLLLNIYHSCREGPFFFSAEKCWYFPYFSMKTCCGYSLEASQWDSSNEYPQHMLSCRKKKNIMWISPLIWSYDVFLWLVYIFFFFFVFFLVCKDITQTEYFLAVLKMDLRITDWVHATIELMFSPYFINFCHEIVISPDYIRPITNLFLGQNSLHFKW